MSVRRKLRRFVCRIVGHRLSIVPAPLKAGLYCSRCFGHSGWYEIYPADYVLGSENALLCYGPIIIRDPRTMAPP